MEFSIEKVCERDIDLYIINKFLNDSKFKELFLKKINCKNYQVCKCLHSFADENGESDITIILENDNRKIGLLIEDKINAIAMPKQYERYILRAEKQKHEGLFDNYYIFIIAPKSYIDSNTEAKKYDNKISYEEILDYISGDVYGESLIKEAIEVKKKGYGVIENKAVTLFWQKYYEMVENRFSDLKLNINGGARGSKACWPVFFTPIPNIHIIHKSNKGFLDLTFRMVSQYKFQVYDIVKNVLKENMTFQQTGKSLAIRIDVPKIDFKKDFEEQEENVIKCLEEVKKMQEFMMKKIDYMEILRLDAENLIKKAIEEKTKRYEVVENKAVTLFWEKYYDLVENKFSDLKLNRIKGPRGSDANWPIFSTQIKKVKILHKADRGYVDLTFRRVSQYYSEVYDIVKNVLKENMKLEQTAKSLAIRIIVPKIDFEKDFKEQEENVIKCLEVVKELQEFMKKIDYMEILRLGNS